MQRTTESSSDVPEVPDDQAPAALALLGGPWLVKRAPGRSTMPPRVVKTETGQITVSTKAGKSRSGKTTVTQALGRGVETATAGRLLRGSGLIWPGSGPDALVEGVWSEISSAGPDDGSGLGIHGHLCEPVTRASLRKHGAMHAVQYVQFADQVIGERQTQNAVAHDCDAGDIRCEADHWSGSIC